MHFVVFEDIECKGPKSAAYTSVRARLENYGSVGPARREDLFRGNWRSTYLVVTTLDGDNHKLEVDLPKCTYRFTDVDESRTDRLVTLDESGMRDFLRAAGVNVQLPRVDSEVELFTERLLAKADTNLGWYNVSAWKKYFGKVNRGETQSQSFVATSDQLLSYSLLGILWLVGILVSYWFWVRAVCAVSSTPPTERRPENSQTE